MLGAVLQIFAQLTSMGVHVNNDVNIHDTEIIIVVLDILSACLVLPQIFACAKLGQTLRNEATPKVLCFCSILRTVYF